MQNAIILHGCPEKENYYDHSLPSESNAHWLPWLQNELLIRDIHAVTPEVPHSYEPKWTTWCKEVERFDITADTILVGHSCGGGFWLRYLSEHPELRVGRVVLVSPWLDPGRSLQENFFDFEIDADLAARTGGVMIYYSDNDLESVHETLDLIRPTLNGASYREFKGYGHFCHGDMGTVEFPELLTELVGD